MLTGHWITLLMEMERCLLITRRVKVRLLFPWLFKVMVKIVVAGLTTLFTTDIVVIRYNSDGSLDNSFDGDGMVVTDFGVTDDIAYSLAIQTNGKIVVAGVSNRNFALVRYNPNGSLDNTFDGDGKVTTDFGADDIAYSVSIQTDGKIVVAGEATIPVPGGIPEFAVARYNSDGSPDNTFDTDGRLTTTWTAPASARSVGIESNGNIVVSGYLTINGASTFAITRYTSNGTLNGRSGPLGNGSTQAFGSIIKDNKLYVAGQHAVNPSTSDYRGVVAAYILQTTGLNFKYYEGTWTTLPDFNSLNPVRTGNSPNVDISLRTPGRNDNFAFIWQGYIIINTPGDYTFETISDDGSRLYFNLPYSLGAAPTVDNDGLHAPISATGTVNIPAAGVYPIAITFFENSGGESMQVLWTGPGIPRQPIPNSAFTVIPPPPPGGQSGLNYSYYEGTFTALPDFSTLTPIRTGNTPNLDISVRTPGRNDFFAFNWDGFINIPTSGVYTFELVSDDGSKLYIDGNLICNNDGLHAPVSASGNVALSAGLHTIKITYFENSGGEVIQVYWAGPGFARQLIPNSAFVRPTTSTDGLNFKYYEGTFTALPDFSTLTPVKTGNTPNIDLGVRTPGRNDNFAFVWEGYITLPASGPYTFETVSDDGSKLYFNSMYSPGATPLVNNDGLHAPRSATGNVTASAGRYPIAITFFENSGVNPCRSSGPGPASPGSKFQTLPLFRGSRRRPPVSITNIMKVPSLPFLILVPSRR
jgi:uncharacterized delta-60 repeat protein